MLYCKADVDANDDDTCTLVIFAIRMVPSIGRDGVAIQTV